MAVSKRRGLARESPAELGPQLLLLLLLGCCSGRIHRLVLTVSLTERLFGAEGARLSRRSLWLGVVSSYFPFSLRGMERPGALPFRGQNGLVRQGPSVHRMEFRGASR